MRKILVATVLAGSIAAPAHAHERTQTSDQPLRLTDPQVYEVARVEVPSGQTSPQSTQGRPRTRDSLKNGVIAGVIVGGVIGGLWYASCGHVECGPVLGLSIGLGAAVGAGIDALHSQRTAVPVGSPRVTDERRPFSSGRRFAVAVRKDW